MTRDKDNNMNKLKQTIGFIGAGNMARAILSGMLNAGLIEAKQAIVSDVSAEQLEAIGKLTGARLAKSNSEVVGAADVVIIATKPYHVGAVCEEVRAQTRSGQLFVSICAGIPTTLIEERLGGNARVIRVMPNTPALIGCGAAAVAAGAHATAEDVELVCRIFDSVGKSVRLGEEQLDLVTGLTGSGPAYVFRFTEAMIEAAVELGMPKDAALTLVLQTVYGASRMAIESGKPLVELRQAVTTKGGTTEAGLKVLEEGEFGALIRDCVEAATKRSAELSKG